MKKPYLLVPVTAAALAVSLAVTPVQAESDAYITGSYGFADLDDSANSGNFPNGFTTGQGTTIPAGTELPAGTAVGWDTQFDTGDSFNIAYGQRFGAFRAEIELSFQDNDVESHSGVTVLDSLSLDSEDAGVLITGSDNLGASVAAIVGEGRGSLDATYIMLNGYYDFDTGGRVTPFIGAGLGYVDADIEFIPSGVGIVDDSDSTFAFQVMAGLSVELTDSLDLIAQARYRASEDLEVETTLFPANLDIENQTTSFDIGLRYNF